MFTDIVEATARAARIGDGRWRDLLADHDEQVRAQLARFGGREVQRNAWMPVSAPPTTSACTSAVPS
jgi:class 3 adenylate cyclase